jgi:hypothetical protein
MDVRDITEGLLDYCRREDWAGYDPYDALNSRVFRATPFSRSKYCRIAFTQFMKRCPINFRPLLGVPKKRNPKGTALFITALLKLKKVGVYADDVTIQMLVDDLIRARSQEQSHTCWGYSFAWQMRGALVPEGSPNIICTTFAGNALLDAWQTFRRQDCLDHAISAAGFLKERLYDDLGAGEACFNYTLVSKSRIHNANLLGAAFLARLAQITQRAGLAELVGKATRYSVRKQASDGSWAYGEHPTQKWIDNFHTGYNLCALQTIKDATGSVEHDQAIRKGLDFYLNNFFLAEGTPKYYHDRTYPIDIHSAAQSLLTLSRFPDVRGTTEQCACVLTWTLANMQNANGSFRFQKHRFYSNSVPYMRWSQAWMLTALGALLSSNRSSPLLVQ